MPIETTRTFFFGECEKKKGFAHRNVEHRNISQLTSSSSSNTPQELPATHGTARSYDGNSLVPTPTGWVQTLLSPLDTSHSKSWETLNEDNKDKTTMLSNNESINFCVASVGRNRFLQRATDRYKHTHTFFSVT